MIMKLRVMDLATQHRPSQVTLILSLAALFLLTHPYDGIRHDAILYTAQALHNLHPEHFTRDLFFEFGSQDDWTLYGKLLGKLISVFGLRTSNLAFLLVAQALWWSGAWYLVRKLLPSPWYWFCLFFIACMPADYGSDRIFSYDEVFLTARLPAEGLGLWAVALILERRPIAAFALAATAVAIHPLIGAVALSMVLLQVTPRVKWWAVFLIALAAFAIIESPAFPSLHAHPFDPRWRELVRYNIPFIFPTRWTLNAWSKACWVTALPLLLCSTESPGNRRLWSNLALLGVSGLAFSTVADMSGQDALWIQLQTWRTLWLLTVVQWIAIALLFRHSGRTRPMLIWLLALCWLLLDVGGGVIALWIAVTLLPDVRQKSPPSKVVRFGAIPVRFRYLLICASVPCLLIWLFWQLAYHYAREMYPNGTIAFNVSWLELVIHTRLVIELAAILIALNLARDRIRIAGLYLLLVALLVLSVVNVDQRSDVAKVVETRADHADLAPFKGLVPAGDVVYWDGSKDEILYPWLLMKTSSYFSPIQSAGMVFHRQTTFESIRRFGRIKLDEQAGRPFRTTTGDDDLTVFSRPAPNAPPLTRAALEHICRDPVLDFIVSPGNYPELSTHQAWSPDGHVEYWLYDCGRVRSLTLAPTTVPD